MDALHSWNIELAFWADELSAGDSTFDYGLWLRLYLFDDGSMLLTNADLFSHAIDQLLGIVADPCLVRIGPSIKVKSHINARASSPWK